MIISAEFDKLLISVFFGVTQQYVIICIGNLIYFGTAITIESKKFLYIIIYFIKFFLNLSFKKTVHYNIKL
jgi:hypothetical protein